MDTEKLSPYYVESNLRHLYSSVFEAFIRTNCPKFESFRANREMLLMSGKGIEVGIFEAQVEYVRMLEELVRDLLRQCGVSQESFVAALHDEDGANVVVKALKFELTRYQDFDAFSEMMEDAFNERFTHVRAPPHPGAGAGPRSDPSKRSVRVLWDIENVRCPKKLGGMRTVSALSSFLKSVGLMGQGVDCRVTAFFCTGRVSRPVVAALDKASVELVWVSSKREDADRKLGTRIMQEMHVLPAATTTIVLITGDTDFRSHVQQLSNAGFQAVVIHDANNAAHAESLSLHAHSTYRWTADVLSHAAGAGAGAGAGGAVDDDAEGEGDDQIDAETSGHQKVSSQHMQKPPANDRNAVIEADGDTVGALVLEAGGRWALASFPRDIACGLHEGVVHSWKGAFGFVVCPLRREPAAPDGVSTVFQVRIYVHITVLPELVLASADAGCGDGSGDGSGSASSRMVPSKGQRVGVLVASGDRGLFAKKIQLIE